MLHFSVDDKQVAKLRQWQNDHKCEFRTAEGYRRPGTLGDIDTYCFTPLSVGESIVVVKCACGSKVDLTGDISNWW